MSDVEKLPARTVRERYPHVEGSALQYARKAGHINSSVDEARSGTGETGRRYLYHLDDDFERWQAKHLPVGDTWQDAVSRPEDADLRRLTDNAYDALTALREAHGCYLDACYAGQAEAGRSDLQRAVQHAWIATRRLLAIVQQAELHLHPHRAPGLPEPGGDGATYSPEPTD